MALPVPDLDDRRFQDLVDDAKRIVQQRCPEWSDHNVSDPGVTLIELFAWMTEQVIYRLNRVPDRLYVTFLDMLGVQLFPPTPARVAQTFWLAAPQDMDVVLERDTRVSTVRTATEQQVVFSSVQELTVVSVTLAACRSSLVGADGSRDLGPALDHGQPAPCFSATPVPGDALLVGLSAAVPRNAVTLRLECEVQGIGVDPTWPPLVWEAATAAGWVACDVHADGTGGLNGSGDLVLHVPDGHTASVVDGVRAGWLRARVLEPEEGQPTYSAAPALRRAEAFTIGGTTLVAQAEPVGPELLGISNGGAGQRFAVARRPVVAVPGSAVLEVAAPDADGWQAWEQVSDFAESGPQDTHYVLDAVAGEIQLGPAVREPDGAFRQYGAVPLVGAALRLRDYYTGGGAVGNVSAGALSVLVSSIPGVDRTQNRQAAVGGRDTEDVDNAKVRGPALLRSRGRAVTAEDFEQLALAAAPEVARVRAVATPEGEEPGVRVLVVPAVVADGERLRFGQLVPDEDTLQRVAAELDRRRLVGTRLVVEPPTYQGVTVVARLRAVPSVAPQEVQVAAVRALYRWFDPVVGGPDGGGWPFGRPVHVGEVYGLLQRVRGVDLVEDVRLFPADPVTGQRGEATQRVELAPTALAFPYEHQVRVQ